MAFGVFAERRKFFSDELFDAYILQADCVEHAGRSLDNAWWRMARNGLEGDTLGDEATDPFERNDLFEFDSIAEGATGRDDGVDQFEPGQLALSCRVSLTEFFLGRGVATWRSSLQVSAPALAHVLPLQTAD